MNNKQQSELCDVSTKMAGGEDSAYGDSHQDSITHTSQVDNDTDSHNIQPSDTTCLEDDDVDVSFLF